MTIIIYEGGLLLSEALLVSFLSQLEQLVEVIQLSREMALPLIGSHRQKVPKARMLQA